MNIEGILRPHELPFDCPEILSNDINELLAAMERDDINLDCYMNEVQCSARCLSDENDNWIRQYYLSNGWEKDLHE